MDDFNQNDFEEGLNENNSKNKRSLVNDFVNGFVTGYQSGMMVNDVKNINERTGKNEKIGNTDENVANITGEKKGKGSDELDNTKNDSNKDDDKTEKKSNSGLDDKSSEDKDKKVTKSEKDTNSSNDNFIKRKLMKYKIYFIIGGIGIVLFLGLFLYATFVTIIDNMTLGLTNFFGIPEETSKETGNVPGLVDSDRYIYDDNGNEMNNEELVHYLESNSNCDGNFWTGISDGWNSLWGKSIRDSCELIRYIESETKSKGVDEALIVSTIFYGYSTRPSAKQYINQSDVPDELSGIEHYKNLGDILEDKNINITREDVSKIIESAHSEAKSYYYVWEIEEDKDKDGKVTKVTGKCKYKESKTDKYNLDKWKVFMRFGEEAASMFDEVVLKSKNFESSSDECKNAGDLYTDDKLTEEVEAVAASRGDNVEASVDFDSVNKAREELEAPDETGSDKFFQAADPESKTKDYFDGYKEITFDYRNGYAYKHFPTYSPSMDPGGSYYGKVDIKYDDVFTPKEIESLIENIVSRKVNMNEALYRTDPDTNNDYKGGLNGFSGVPTGANCMQYLPASLNEITVKLTDCYGGYMDTVTFEDYIIGVANGEVSNRNDDYVLSQMVAAISYALNRHNNYANGSEIMMRSGTCDQVYCSMKRGCHSVNTPVGSCSICNTYYIGGGKANPSLYSKYQALYEIASDYLLVKDGHPFSAHYVSTVQNRWYEKSAKGMSFTQIMQEEYEDEGATLIRCSDTPSEVKNENLPDKQEEKIGNKATTEYPNVSPNLGNFYGFSYKNGNDSTHVSINPEWKNANLVTISPDCKGNSEYNSKKYTVNKAAVSSFNKAFKNVCKILTNGVKIKNGEICKYNASDIADGTVFIERKTSGGTFDLHAYGLSQDINYSKSYTINGKTYRPYNTRNLSDYMDFVNAIGGKEENCQNINYILWAYAYKDAGFYWGGNYGRNGKSGTYDGKLFELKYE